MLRAYHLSFCSATREVMALCHRSGYYRSSMNAREEIDRLTEKLKMYQDKYYKEGISLIPDSEYDRLSDHLAALEREHPDLQHPDSPTKRVGSDLTNDFPEVRHTIPVLSLDKAYSDGAVLDFFNRSIQKEGGLLSFAAEEKIDGISMVLYYEKGVLVRAVTRGNGEIGNDVTPNIMTMPSVPLSLPESIDIAVRGEVYLGKEDFLRLNEAEPDESKRAANPRNLAAGTVRRQKSSEARRVPLTIFCYEGFWDDKDSTPQDHLHILAKLKALGFRINPHLAFFSSDAETARRKLDEAGLDGEAYAFSDIDGFIRKKAEERAGLPYEIDGLVFKINELDVRERFGYTEHHPRWAIAYKFDAPQAEARLLGITVQVGRTGRITPVAEITPTKLGGSTIRRATLHNQEYIDELELAIGDTVSISKRGDVIPAVENVIEKNTDGNTVYRLPHDCPCCHTPIVQVGGLQFCPDYDCPDQVKGRISYFASADQMDIETLGPKTVALLYDAGILKGIEDIYTADFTAAASLPGMGEKSIGQLEKGIRESLSRPFVTVLSSLGVAEIGRKTAQMLVENGFDSIDRILEAADLKDPSAFASIPGFGSVMGERIIEAFSSPRLRETIEALRKAGLHLDAASDQVEEKAEDQVFSGQVWCITGSFKAFNPRSKALREIEKRGGRTVSSVTSKTTHLLAGEGGGSKRKEAERLGVQIVTEEEFLSAIGAGTERGEDGQLLLF